MRVSIAAQACLPILELGLDWYAGFTGIVVYPGDFRVRRARDRRARRGARVGRRARRRSDARRAGGAVLGRRGQRSGDQRGDPRVRAQARHAERRRRRPAAAARRHGPRRLGSRVRGGLRGLLRRARARQGHLARSVRRRAPVRILRRDQRGVLRAARRDPAPLSRRLRPAQALLPTGSAHDDRAQDDASTFRSRAKSSAAASSSASTTRRSTTCRRSSRKCASAPGTATSSTASRRARSPRAPEFSDPAFKLPVEWLQTRKAIREAAAKQKNPASPSRILIVSGSTRSEHTCPGEVSKTRRLADRARRTIEAQAGFEVDLLELSHLADEPWKVIHPCKACVSTSMPLCHWPCSCYPNHAMGQTNDWMAELYPRWVAAHGVLVVCPVHWYQAPASLKLMMDRLVCADGGNPDPTTTRGKDPARGQGARARRLAVSAPPRRPRVRRGRARRFAGPRGRARSARRMAHRASA